MRQRTVALCCGALGCLALGALCCELLGRRRLFLIGGTLATLSPAALALCFGVPAAADSPRALQVVTAASTVVYLVAYNTALAALGWVVVVEALPLPYRAFGAGVAVATRWLGAFAVAMSFRWLNTCAHHTLVCSDSLGAPGVWAGPDWSGAGADWVFFAVEAAVVGATPPTPCRLR